METSPSPQSLCSPLPFVVIVKILRLFFSLSPAKIVASARTILLENIYLLSAYQANFHYACLLPAPDHVL